METLEAPFTYFGAKSRVATLVWERFGNVDNYIEPFFGSGAVLLARPVVRGTETVNDLCSFVANFWRSISKDPEAVAAYASEPVIESDHHARHAWLISIKDELPQRLEGDPDWFDAKVAGWWVLGKSCAIGSGFCTGQGPWKVVDGKLINTSTNRIKGAKKELNGISRQMPNLTGAGQGVNRQMPQLGGAGRGINRAEMDEPKLFEWFAALGNRFRRVRVLTGDWSRVTGPSVTFGNGLTAFFADPPYSSEEELSGYYRVGDSNVAKDVFKYAIKNGDNPLMRICVAGYAGEHDFPETWECLAWKTAGGYGNQRKDGTNENGSRERLWFSPHCLKPEFDLFSAKTIS